MPMTFKQGLDFFPHNCGEFDDNLEYILALHGSDGYYIYFRLLEKIYSKEGYYMKADHKTLTLYSTKICKPIKVIETVLKDLIKEGLFNQELYDKHQIITSAGIQKRFLKITKLLRRKEIRIIDEYIIGIDAIAIVNNDDINGIDDDINKQRKGKEKKGKEIINKEPPDRNYLSVEDLTVYDVLEHLENNYKLQFPNWQKLYPLANIQQCADSFMLKNAFETFNDEKHFKNAFTKYLKEVQRDNEFKKGKFKKPDETPDKLSYAIGEQ